MIALALFVQSSRLLIVCFFSGSATSMVSINAEGNVLAIASGAIEVLFFDVSNEPFPSFWKVIPSK